jgi:hypothetical protein
MLTARNAPENSRKADRKRGPRFLNMLILQLRKLEKFERKWLL